MISNQARHGEKHKKTVTLTDNGREHIQAYADKHQMTFSATIEVLALIGMEADLAAVLLPLVQETVNQALQRNFNRLAKLSLLGAAEAAMAHDLTKMLLLQTVRQEAVTHPQDFELRLSVSYDPNNQHDARIRGLYNHLRQLARQRQQRLLKRPLAQLVAELAPPAETQPSPDEMGEGGHDES